MAVAGPRLAPWLLAAALLLAAAAAAAASSSACPPQCICDDSLVDCSKRWPAAIPQQLPVWVRQLDLSHNQLVSTKHPVFEGLHTLLEVNINHNLLSTIPTLGSATANITILSLAHNRVTEVIAEDLLPYSALETLDLSSNLISEIKTSSFPIMQLRNLHLNNNRITILEPGCFDNLSSTLLVLKLNRNKITVIHPKSFHLPQLQYLELKRNRMRIIESLTFHGLDSLKSLKLQRNGICELKDGAFWGLNEITELDLEHNNLTEVTKGWLYGLKLLQHLHLSQNAITRVSADAWEFCQKLTELDMTYNQMTRLDESTFVGLNLLESLYMGDNRVSYIADGVFSSLSNLLTLDLRNNEISWAIEDSNGAFTGLAKLRKLILQGSKITSITKKAFSGLETLEYLDLSNNAIMSIQENSFAQMSLKELGLNTSSLLCDCQLKWLPPFLVEKQFQHMVTANCAHPVWLAGKSIFNVDAEDYICDAFPRPLITVHPETTVALRGMNVSFSCTACSSSDSPMAAAWRKDSELLYEAEIQNYSSLQEQDGEFVEYTTILQLRNVNFTDEGWYQCVITNYFGSNYSNKAKLTVNELPSFMKTPMDLTIRTGAMARLECAAGGHPMPQIAWQKDGGTDFPAARERRMHVMPEDDVFFIANVKMEDMGMYSCMAQNTAGGISANATLTVLETPSFVRPLENRTVARGETAVLQCIASGSPTPRLNWTKDNGPLTVTERHFFAAANQLLIIVDAGPEDIGKYTCVMSNTLGTERGHIFLNVIPTSNCDSMQKTSVFGDDGWTTIGIVIIVVVVCVVGTSLVWVIVIYHMRRKSEDYSITNTDEMNLPADIPSYLSSQGTLSEPQEGYSNSEAGSHQQLMASTAHGYVHKGTDGICYVDTGSETDADLLTTPLGTNLHGRMGCFYAGRSSFHPSEPREGLAQQTNPGGTSGPLVICSDCYDNANIYSRNREYCPYTFLGEEDPLEHSLTNIMGQLPKDSFTVHAQHEGIAIDSLMTEANMSVYLTNHNRKSNPASAQQHQKESCPQPPWGSSTDSGHSHYSQQPVTIHENPQAFLEGDNETEDGAEPSVAKSRLSQRSLEQNTGNERTLDMQAYGATT
ncbi:leucine-rich repeats and immunoglobulin-like domains protein 2 isoform X1 [Chiloscyllium plagiosum]|uniref:leucine-rich repeats and immunoglobulin-like domains protein 2 isoform X1 n=1 Tax=Chiloscyllium plagiosum TaxID=36176 RepID=UPI001CB7FFC5|nr:leucine-rich repeats and immunoglobulin-like domains protein 2 isoform X1 [Chiloscyllium plagiosum]